VVVYLATATGFELQVRPGQLIWLHVTQAEVHQRSALAAWRVAGMPTNPNPFGVSVFHMFRNTQVHLEQV
jgi:hypothetical protein